jgi:hypothetical protein
MVVNQTFEEVHGLVMEMAKPWRPLIFERDPCHQHHDKMNVCILGNAMAVQRRNDQKVVNCTRAKTQHKWDKLVIVAK